MGKFIVFLLAFQISTVYGQVVKFDCFHDRNFEARTTSGKIQIVRMDATSRNVEQVLRTVRQSTPTKKLLKILRKECLAWACEQEMYENHKLCSRKMKSATLFYSPPINFRRFVGSGSGLN